MTCDTVGIMSKAMSLRLPDDVAKALEQAAKEQERSQAQVIVRALRVALDADQNKNWNIPAWSSEFVAAQIPAGKPFRTSPDGKQCKHGMFRCDKGCWK